MNTTLPSTMELLPPQNYARWKLQPTRHLIHIARCWDNSICHTIIDTERKDRYYEGGVSSVYLWELDDGGFAGAVLLKKSESFDHPNLHLRLRALAAMAPPTASDPEGSWDSVHVFEAAERGRQAHYKLTSTIMLQLVTHQSQNGSDSNQQSKAEKGAGWKGEGDVTLSGSMTRQVRQLLVTFDQINH